MRVKFSLPKTGLLPAGYAICKYCGSKEVVKYGKYKKFVLHFKIREVRVYRMKCKRCKRTFRVYPMGVGRAVQTDTLKAMSVMLYVLGLSYDNVSNFLSGMGVPISKGTCWNNFQEFGERIVELRKKIRNMRVKIAGFDLTYFKVRKKKIPVALLVNILKGKPVEIKVMMRRNEKSLKRAFKKMFEKMGIEVLITDDADEMENITADIGSIKRGLCIAHLRKNFAKREREFRKEFKENFTKYDKNQLKKLMKDMRKIKMLLRELPEDMSYKLEEIYFKYAKFSPPGKGERADIFYKFKRLVSKLWDKTDQIILFKKFGLDGTNNVCEREIGLTGKIRYKMMRGV